LADFEKAYDSASTSAGIARSFVTDANLAKYKKRDEALKDAEQAEGYAGMLMNLRDHVVTAIREQKKNKKGGTRKITRKK
jgi:hypothetical protein